MMYALIQPVRLIVEWDGKEIGLIPSVLSIIKAVLLETGKRIEVSKSLDKVSNAGENSCTIYWARFQHPN